MIVKAKNNTIFKLTFCRVAIYWTSSGRCCVVVDPGPWEGDSLGVCVCK